MRKGKKIDIFDPIYLLDERKGTCRIPTTSGDFLVITNIKRINRTAHDSNYCDLTYKGETFRIQKDELEEALRYA